MSDTYQEAEAPSDIDYSDVAWALGEICNHTRLEKYRKYHNYYSGKQDLKFATEKFNAAFGQLFKAFSYNRCRAVVGAHTDRLYVETFDAGENQAIVDKAEEIWGLNNMDDVQLEIHASALITGAGYLFVWENDEPDEDENSSKVVMWPQDPSTIAVRYKEEKPTILEIAAKVWIQRDERMRMTLYYEDRIVRLVSRSKVKDGNTPKPPDFELYTDDDSPVVDNPYGKVPIFPFFNHGTVGDTCGTSELDDVIPLQNAMNKTLTDELITEEFMAYPQRLLIGVETGQNPYVDQSNDQRSVDQTINAFAAGALRILTISDPNAKVAEFSAAQLSQFTDMGDWWDKAISRTSRVPVHYLTLSGDFPSGRALRTAESPFVAKLEAQQRKFKNPWQQAMRFAMKIEGTAVKGRFSVKWRIAAPMAEEDMWDLVLQKVAVGVPLEIALADMGWSASKIEELKKVLEEQQQQMMEQMAAGSDPNSDMPRNRDGDLNTAQRANKTREGRRGNLKVIS